jgi:hypothetical protein
MHRIPDKPALKQLHKHYNFGITPPVRNFASQIHKRLMVRTFDNRDHQKNLMNHIFP